jgi:hypothetical protein
MEVGTDVDLLRLLVPKPDYVGDDLGTTTFLAFRPTDADKKSAQEHGHPVRVTTWDLGRTTLPEAIAFRGRQDCRPFVLSGQDVVDVGSRFSIQTLRAVYDPLDIPAANMPGPNGHVGIEGLEMGAVPHPRSRPNGP